MPPQDPSPLGGKRESVRISMEIVEAATATAGSGGSRCGGGASRAPEAELDKGRPESWSCGKGKEHPPSVHRKLNFDADSFISEPLCNTQFQSRALDVATVYWDEVNESDELQRAKKHAFDIMVRRQKNRNKSDCGSKKKIIRVGSLSKDLFLRHNSKANAARCSGEEQDVHGEMHDTALATVNTPN